MARPPQILLFVAQAGGAFAATDPGKRRAAVADLHAFRVGSHGHDFAFDLVAHRVGHFEIGQRHFVAAAEVEIAIVDMHIAVADAGNS